MTYTPQKPRLAESSDELRARIPGWGADLDPADRPSVPRERFAPELSGAHWEYPEEQPEKWPRERSIEHTQLPPAFGTTCPPKGLSGAIRKFAYAKYSEGRAAHWLLLMAGDRVDVLESALRSLVTLRPDNPITQTGVLSEVKCHGISSRDVPPPQATVKDGSDSCGPRGRPGQTDGDRASDREASAAERRPAAALGRRGD
jgi:hypothetical protein